METKINTNAIPDGGIDIEKLKAGIVPDISHLETKEDASAKLQEAKDYTDTKVAGLIDAATITFQYAANESEVPAERVPGVVYLVGNEKVMITFTMESLSGRIDYQAEEGMTWGEWVESEYNTPPGMIIIKNGAPYLYHDDKYIEGNNIFQYADDIIINNCIYSGSSGLPAPD